MEEALFYFPADESTILLFQGPYGVNPRISGIYDELYPKSIVSTHWVPIIAQNEALSQAFDPN